MQVGKDRNSLLARFSERILFAFVFSGKYSKLLRDRSRIINELGHKGTRESLVSLDIAQRYGISNMLEGSDINQLLLRFNIVT